MIDSPVVLLILFPLAAYVIGATPFGFIIGKAKGVDLRKVGSGNIGATNVGRSIGRGWGYFCFLLDVLKGFLPVLLAGAILKSRPASAGFPDALGQLSWVAVGCGAILGHVFTFWLGFKGGKGVATALGVVLGIYPYFTWAGLVALGVWIAVTLIWRYVSLGSIIAAGAFLPLFAVFNYSHFAELWPLALFAAVMVSLIIIRHRTNIRRLLSGQENKIGRKDRE